MIKKNIIYPIAMLLIAITSQYTLAQDHQKSASATLKSNPISLTAFKHCDIGNPSIAGTDKITAAGVDISAGGADIWGVKDEFNFVYMEHTGDFDIACRVESLTAANLYTKAGLMAREDLSASCRHIFFQVFPDNNPRNKNNGGYEYQYRQVRDSSMKAIYPKSDKGIPEFPVKYPNTWIRLQRIKNDFTGFYSTDGKTWKVYTTYQLDLPPKIYLGMAVTSHNSSQSASAGFRNISELKQ
jgi:regulation of enolase protein 1 (concanavalin A-like superfamily)